ncbi:MAG: nucleotidyltransferase family protein, partial [Anaerolineae bacterium]
LLDAGREWGTVVAAARAGQLGPLLVAGVLALGADAAVPRQAMDDLRRLYVGSLARANRTAAVLQDVLRELADAGIPVLGHKAVALNALVFADPALRLAGDIDLSVPDDRRHEAERLVAHIRQPLAARYPTRREPDALHVELDGAAHHDMDIARHGGGHWQALGLDWQAIWGRARPAADRLMLVPEPTDLLTCLVANSIRRGFAPTRVVSDIAEELRVLGGSVNWRLFAADASRSGLDRRAWIALGLARDWFDAAVPAAALEPPDGLRPLPYERWLLEWKRRRPFGRTPTRVLWAGGRAEAARQAAWLARGVVAQR